MRKTGLSTNGGKGIGIKTFEDFKKNNIEAMEISLESQEYENVDWKAVEKFSRDTGVELWSLHLPFWPFETNDIAGRQKEIRLKTIALQSEYIKKAADIGINTVVIHPSGEPIADLERPLLMKYAKESLYELAKVCSHSGAVLAVENLPRTCLGRNSREIAELISVDSSLRVCFDTNHLLQESIKEFINTVGDKLRTIHVSDYDGVDECHWMPGEGIIDWHELMDLLDRVGYDGVFMYEVSYEIPENIERERRLTPVDFYRNCCELHNREKITVIGKRKK